MKRIKFSTVVCLLGLVAPLSIAGFECDLFNSAVLELDYLLWNPFLEGLSPSTTIDENFPTTTGVTFQETDHFFKNRWSSGVRAVFGFKPPCHTWDVKAAYTFFSTRLNNRYGFTSPSSEALTSNVFSNFLINPIVANNFIASSVSSAWKLNFNQFDIDFGKCFFDGNDVHFYPLIGVKTLWLNHHYQSDSAYTILSETLTKTSSEFNARTHYIGAGPKAGFETSIKVGSCLDFLGDISGSILWGYFKLQESISQATNSVPLSLPSLAQTHSKQIAVFNVSVGLAIRWKYVFNNGQCMRAKIGWEQHFYSDINHIQNVINNMFGTGTSQGFNQDSNVQRGYLSLSGLTFGLTYLF